MIPTAAIRERLRDQVTQFKTVRGAAALAAIVDRGQFAGNEAFVVVSNKKAATNKVANGVSQMTTARVAVMYFLRDASDPTGQAVSDGNEAVVDSIGAALLNWPPAEGFSAFEYVGGGLVQLVPPGALYSEEFTTQFLVRKV